MTPASRGLAVQEMVRATMYRLAAKRRRPQSTKMEILKVLYDARNRLSDTNPYRDALPYYWYRDGPFCQPVYDGLRNLIGSRLAKLNIKPGAYETYSLKPKYKAHPLVKSDDDMDEVRSAIRGVVDGFVNINDTRRAMYENAPYQIYTSYRLEFEPKFESLCRGVARADTDPDPDKVAGLLDAAASDYPKGGEFDEQWQPFGDFVMTAMSFLTVGPGKFGEAVAMKMSDACKQAWNALTAGIRIEKHDPYYNASVPGWISSRDEELSGLRSTVKSCAPSVLERSGRRTVIESVRRLGMERSAARLLELERIADEDPDEDRMSIKSMSRLAAFIAGRRLPEPDIGACPNGDAQAVWWPPDGILSMDFGPGDAVTYASVLRGAEWRRHGRATPGSALSDVAPAVEALRA